jgi:hypothetical protein
VEWKDWSRRADLNGRPGPLTLSRACQELLLTRRNGTLLLSRSRSAINQVMDCSDCGMEGLVGASRFERPTSCSQGRRANQAALRPDASNYNQKTSTFRYTKNQIGNGITIPFPFERPVRPAHLLAGVPRVAPYSSRRHPSCPKAGALTRLRYAPQFLVSLVCLVFLVCIVYLVFLVCLIQTQ